MLFSLDNIIPTCWRRALHSGNFLMESISQTDESLLEITILYVGLNSYNY